MMRFVLLTAAILLINGCRATLSVSSQEVLHHVHAISCTDDDGQHETVFILENGIIRKIRWINSPFKCDTWNGSTYWDLTIDGYHINYTDLISMHSTN